MDLGIDADNNDGLGLPDHSAAEEAIEEVPGQPGKEVLIDDGTLTPADYTPVMLDASGLDPSTAVAVFSYGSAFHLFAPDGTLLAPGAGYSLAALGFTGTDPQEVVLKLDAVGPTSSPSDGTISVAVNAAPTGVSPVYLADAVQADGTDVKVEFSKPEARPGTAAARAEPVDVTVTRTGAAANADAVTLSVVNKGGATDGAASLDTQTINLAAGEKKKTVTVKVSGQRLSGANQDVQVNATEGGKVKATLPVTVVQPQKWTNDAVHHQLQGKGVAAQDAQGRWCLNYRVDVTFTVEDQFEKPLDSIWAGVGIAEHIVNDPQAFSGFVTGTASTPIDSAAHAVDPVQSLGAGALDNLTQQVVKQIEAGQVDLLIRTISHFGTVRHSNTKSLMVTLHTRWMEQTCVSKHG